MKRLGSLANHRRFGTIALEKGFITKNQLKDALSRQVDEESGNRSRPLIGELLVSMGYMTERQLDEVLSPLFTQII